MLLPCFGYAYAANLHKVKKSPCCTMYKFRSTLPMLRCITLWYVISRLCTMLCCGALGCTAVRYFALRYLLLEIGLLVAFSRPNCQIKNQGTREL